jgi:Domain of unknown function (DUF4351)
MSPSAYEYLQHILDETAYIIDSANGLNKTIFMQNETLKRAIVLRQLNRRLGALESSVETLVNGLSLARLEALGEALLDFNTASDLQDWLRSHD